MVTVPIRQESHLSGAPLNGIRGAQLHLNYQLSPHDAGRGGVVVAVVQARPLTGVHVFHCVPLSATLIQGKHPASSINPGGIFTLPLGHSVTAPA